MTKNQRLKALADLLAAANAADTLAMGKAIAFAVDRSKEDRTNAQGMYERYIGNVPIKERKYLVDGKEVTNKINRKLAHDFFGEIVDDKVGFMYGHGIAYSYDDKANEAAIERLSEFVKYSDIEDHDTETGRLAAICGTAYRLIWHESGRPYIADVDPWDVVYLTDGKDIAALVLYEVAAGSRCDCYIGDGCYTFSIGKADDTAIVYDKTGNPEIPVENQPKISVTALYIEEKKTGLIAVPVIEYLNNKQRQGDCAKALELIDQYDRLTSDTFSEMEQFRLAYFAVFGAELPEDEGECNKVLERMRQTGVLVFPSTPGNPSGGSGQFIVKNVDANAVKILLDMLEDKIYRFCRAINYGRDAMSGAQATGVVLKQRLQQIRHKCLTSWAKAQTANREQWRILAALWTLNQTPFDYLKVKAAMTLDIPTDIRDEASMLTMLDGKVSRRTALEQCSFITDVDAEIRRMEEEGMLDRIDPNDAEKQAAADEIEAETKAAEAEEQSAPDYGDVGDYGAARAE